jgi:uncharacterized membrane-anchored protein
MRLSPLAVAIVVAALASFAPRASAAAESGGGEARTLQWQTGRITIGENLAVADLPEGYRYLQRDDARHVVEKIMHNPPDPKVVGMIMRKGDDADDAFMAIVSYDDSDGHVKDDDAETIDYAKLLAQLQAGAREAAPELRKQGYDGYSITGWAEAPHYDRATHKMYWAQNARFDGQDEDTLNYNVRLLGARGVLIINALGAAKDLPQVAAGSKIVLTRTELSSGNRYEDFKPGVDKVAAYGIGGLIAAGLLTKLGFFGVIGKFLLAFIKPILIGVAVVGGALAKLFARKQDPRDENPRAEAKG